jgi:putative ABC transport system permease protein
MFTRTDVSQRARLTLIDEHLARIHFKDENPVGRSIRLEDEGPAHIIIGIAAATRSLAVDDRSNPKVYVPLHGARFVESRLLVHYSGRRIDVARSVERAVSSADPALTVRIAGIEDNIATALAPVKIASIAASVLGGLALVIACLGLYGVVSRIVSQRKRELGIRLALGASKRNILTLLLRQGLTPVLVGALIGVPVAAAGAQVIEVMLYGVRPIDPVAFISTLLLLAMVSAAAALVPARAALSADPATALRHD